MTATTSDPEAIDPSVPGPLTPTPPGPAVALPPSLAAPRLERLLAGLCATGPSEDVRLPFTGDPFVRRSTSTESDLDAAVARARAAQRDWAEVGLEQRAAIGRRLAELITDRSEELLDVIQAETAKSRAHAFPEILEVALLARFLGTHAVSTLRPRRFPGLLPLLTEVRQRRAPVGLVALISPWNYPFSLGVGDGLAALIAGNALLQLPDRQTSLTAALGRELAIEAGLPADLWQIVVGAGDQLGPQVIKRSDLVIFTGSTGVGRQVGRQAAEQLIKADLELGGKNAMIIRADADLDRVIPGALVGCFSSAGQLCESIERIYVHQSISTEFIRRFTAATDALRVGVGFGDDYDVGSLTSADQLAKIDHQVADARRRGARVLAGGVASPEVGPYCYRPTVLTEVPRTAECFAEETFGPVVALTVVGSDDEAVRLANESAYGLNASIWSSDVAAARRLGERLHSGKINLNDAFAAAYGSVHASIGGWGDSGTGARHGREALLAVTRPQTFAVQRILPTHEFGPLRGPRFRRVMLALIRAFRALPGR